MYLVMTTTLAWSFGTTGSDDMDAYKDGWFAHRDGVQDNPYDESSQKYSHYQWDSGWVARFSAVKHGGDLSLDDSLFS